MNVATVLAPFRKLAYQLPAETQHKLVRLGYSLAGCLATFKKLAISYRGYKVFLSGKERGGQQIYFTYLIRN